MKKNPSVSASLRSLWFDCFLCVGLAFTASCKSKDGDFDGEKAPYGPRTPSTQVNSTITFAPGSLFGSNGVSQTTTVVGQETIAGTSYDRLATTRDDDPSKNGEYWIKENPDNTVDFAGFAHTSLVGGIVPAASMTLDTPIKVNLDAPIGNTQVVTASGRLTLTDTGTTSPANITGQYTLLAKDATVATGVGPLSGCSHFTGQAASNSAGIPAGFQGQTINADLYYHPSYGVVAFNAPDLGIGSVMTDSSDCGSADSSGYKIIRKVGVVDATTSFKLDTYDCDGNQFVADMNTHAKMLLELRWVDETQAKTDLQPPSTVNFGPSTVEFGVASGNIFGFTLAEAPASVFHPEENGKGFKYWYAYVSEADKNEDTASNHTTAYHIRVSTMSSAVRVTARIYYKVLSSAIGVQPGGGQIAGNKDAGGSGGATGSRLDGGLLTGTKDASSAETKDASVKPDAAGGSALDAPADSVDATGATVCNLIVNGNAEAAIGSIDGTPVPTPGWIVAGEATAGQYGVNGWPGPADPGPTDRGLNLFSGGAADATSSLTQTINVAQFASAIDGGRVTYLLSGWLGGYDGQDDNATLKATFQNASGLALGSGSIGPVMASERLGASGLMYRSSSAAVPAGTRSVLIALSLVRVSGTANDGYADDLSLVFSGTGTTACNFGTSSDGGTPDSQVDGSAADAGPVYFTPGTPPTGITAPAGAKISALKTTTTLGVGGIFWKDGRLFAASNLGGPIVSVMPGETGTLWANVPSLAGGNPSWRHGVPLTGGNILLAIDYYGGPTGLHEITPNGDDSPWTLASGHSGIGDILALPTGGWVFSDFESYNIFNLPAKNAPETALIPAGVGSFSPGYLANDGLTNTVYFVNMNNLGSEPWFGGDGAIYKMTTGAPTLVASPAANTRFNGLAVGLGGLFPAGLYAADTANSRVVRVESTGTLTPVVVGVPTPSEIRIDPTSKGMALLSADQILFILP